MSTSRIYIPKSAAWSAPSLPELRLEEAHRKALSETAASVSFLLILASLLAVFSFLIVVGPVTSGLLQ